jgi:hypothetical protein
VLVDAKKRARIGSASHESFSERDAARRSLANARSVAMNRASIGPTSFAVSTVPESIAGSGQDEEVEEPLLRELDGTLPWPGKKRRR